MFKIGSVLNYYHKINITIIELTGNLTVGDKIKLFKDGECILTQQVSEIMMNQKKIPFGKPKDVIALSLEVNENFKIQKETEVFRLGQLGT